MEKEEFPKVFTSTPLAPVPVTRVVMNWKFSPLPVTTARRRHRPTSKWTLLNDLLHSSPLHLNYHKAPSMQKVNFCKFSSPPQHKSETERRTPTTIAMHKHQTIAFRGLWFNEECEWVAVLARTKGTINWITEMCAIVVVGKGEQRSLTPQEHNWACRWVTAVSWRSRSTLGSLRTLSSARTRSINAKATLIATLPHASRLFSSRSLLFFYF